MYLLLLYIYNMFCLMNTSVVAISGGRINSLCIFNGFILLCSYKCVMLVSNITGGYSVYCCNKCYNLTEVSKHNV